MTLILENSNQVLILWQKVLYVHCKAYCLNLVLVDAPKSNKHFVAFLNLVEKLYAFCTSPGSPNLLEWVHSVTHSMARIRGFVDAAPRPPKIFGGRGADDPRRTADQAWPASGVLTPPGARQESSLSPQVGAPPPHSRNMTMAFTIWGVDNFSFHVPTICPFPH